MHKFAHYPVMWRKVLEIISKNIDVNKPFLVSDCTIGGGGHSYSILESFPMSYVVGLDIDAEVLERTRENLQKFEDRVSLFHTNYTRIHEIPRFPSIFPQEKKYDCLLVDCGMSSYQLDDPDRGFAYSLSGPLDMRFDRSDCTSLTAEQFINNATEYEISEVFKVFGEEKHAVIAADIINRYRAEHQITNTSQLLKVLNYAFFIGKSYKKLDSVTRCFQALRIFINRELENLKSLMKDGTNLLDNDGALIGLSFHSLEDGIMWNHMKDWVRSI